MYENKSIQETALSFGTDPKNGLSSDQVGERRAKYGLNKLEEKKKKSPFMIFLGEFKDPMVIVLFIAAIISLVLAIVKSVEHGFDFTEFLDVIIIFAVVIINAIIGTVQEVKAEKALEALKRMSAPTATVRRDGKIMQNIPAEELVPGDLVILEEGRNVPADLRLTAAHSLKADESSLTGESVPVEKDASIVLTEGVGIGDRVNEVYMSTPVVYGRGEGIVIGTGMNTEIGHIASMLQGGEEEMTPLQKKLAQLSKFLGYLTLGIVIVVLVVQLLYAGIGGTIADEWDDDLLNSIGLAVAAIPEGLPAVVTIVLALGMQKMARVNTIVRRMASVETLGSVSVICSDKTGTLTQNKMTVVAAYADSTYEDKENLGSCEATRLLAKGMCLCSDASIENGVYGDPTEVALVQFAADLGMDKSSLEASSPRIDEKPFDSVRKMMSTKHREEKGDIVFTKGAMDHVLRHTTRILKNGKAVPITEDDKKEIAEASNRMASRALRVLSLAYRDDGQLEEENLIFIGLVGMVDPPRPAAKGAVETLKGAGITTIMITGDHKDTAFAIANELGIAQNVDQVMSGDQIDACTPEQLQEKVKTVRVFARVSPENKVSIVKAIKANGNIAAMTGDGVNDAPSLKAADIGIAMGITGTDVAKGAADMVLADDNFTSIEKAVEEGRGIYTNIRKTIYFLLSSNIGEVIAMFVAILLGFEAPLIAIHLLWVNLVTDSLPAIALGADKKPDDIMHDKPRDPKESLFAHGGYLVIVGYGIAIAAATLLAFLIKPLTNGCFTLEAINAYLVGEQLEEAQSMAFTVLAFSELFHMLGMTDTKHTFFRVFKDKNNMLWTAFFVGMALQFAVIEIPGVNSVFSVYPLHDHPIDYAYVFGFAVIPLVVHEIVVLINFLIRKSKKAK